MQFREFVDKVEQRIPEDERVNAIKIIEATLETLGERLDRTQRNKLGAQLPNELKQFLLKRQENDYFSVEKFYDRVAARAVIGYPAAVLGSQAVMAILREAVSEGEINNILSQLTEDYGELLGQAPGGHRSTSVDLRQ
ncbi:MAG: DUF2267 domain-containing protein [Chloroflexi bacterium]|nr:DUF2267 domain-containing protein [Chloroflexota bacterium]